MSTPIETRKLYRQVADSIIASIESGDYKRGARLPSERDLAAFFKVSRPTIRETMIALEIRSVVEARPIASKRVSCIPAISPDSDATE